MASPPECLCQRRRTFDGVPPRRLGVDAETTLPEALRACADEEQELSARVQAQQRGVELVERWREEDAQHSTLADAYRDAQSEQRIAMLEELLDIERNAEQEVTAERTVALPEDLARDALIAYAWVSAKPSRWDKAYDSRDAVETAEAMLRERAA